MNQENNEIIKLLTSIKKWIMLGAIGFMLIGVGAVVFSISTAQLVSSIESDFPEEECSEEKHSFSWDNASELFEQGNVAELSALANKRLETHPNDPTAHWFSAKVYYLNEEWDLALESIEKTELYAPNWRKEYTVPLEEKIDELRR